MTTNFPNPASIRQRRIGERYPVQVPLQWAPVAQKRRKSSTVLVAGSTKDVSLLGIGFESPTQTNIARGSMVEVTIGRTRCRATVRSIRPSSRSAHSIYGVEFHDPSMIDQVGDVIGRAGYNKRLTSDFSTRNVQNRSENQHYFDRLTARTC